MTSKTTKSSLTTLQKIRAKLGHLTMEWVPSLWLDTGVPELNQVIGHCDLGLPYGRIIEMSGMESVGKTAIAMSLAALAQRDKALIVWADLENSFSEDWARTRMLDTENMLLIQPYVGRFGDEKEPRMATAQELCAEAESCVTSVKKCDRRMLVLDSIPSLLTEGEASDGLVGFGARTQQDLPQFLGRLLRRWVGFAQAHNTLILMINQLRQSPFQRFGDPWYTPGGNAPRFYCHIRVRARRIKGSRIVDKKKKLIGIRGVLKALKNKSGGLEGETVGYKIAFDGPVEFMPAKDLESED